MRVPFELREERVFLRVGGAPGGHGGIGGTVPPRRRGRRESVPADTPRPKRVVLEGDVAQTVRAAAAREGVPPAVLVREAVLAYRRPSRETLRRYRAVRRALIALGAGPETVEAFDTLILSLATKLGGGR